MQSARLAEATTRGRSSRLAKKPDFDYSGTRRWKQVRPSHGLTCFFRTVAVQKPASGQGDAPLLPGRRRATVRMSVRVKLFKLPCVLLHDIVHFVNRKYMAGLGLHSTDGMEEV